MPDIVVVGLAQPAVAALILPAGMKVARAGPGDVAEVVDGSTIAVLAAAEEGVSLAQAVHATARDAAVLFFTDDAAIRDALEAELDITPKIGMHTACLVGHEANAAVVVAEEIERARLRSNHRETMAQLRGAAREFDGVGADTLSRYLSQLFDHAPMGILLTEPDGTIRIANPGSADLLGWQPRHAVGVSFPSMFTGREAELAADLLADCSTSGACAGETLARTGPDGAIQHLEVTVATVDPDHWGLGMFVLLRDESARVHALEVADRERASAEAAAEKYATLARTLQESLLPPALPDIPGIDIGAWYHPAGDGSEIGGDFYDVFEVNENEWFAVTGDVCGKGVGAARLTALARYTLRATTIRARPIEADLSDLNETLLRQYEEDLPRHENRFATAAVIRFRRDGDEVVVSAGSGGHFPPLVVRADGDVEELGCRGPLLGMFPGGTFVVAETRLAPGEVLLLFTDGVTEARRGDSLFGEDRLREMVSGMGGRAAADVVTAIGKAVVGFQSGTARDDVALLAVTPSHADDSPSNGT